MRIQSRCLEQLQELYDSPYTGAVTTRTATTDGYKENKSHTVVFSGDSISTLNSYGYSPHPLADYLAWVEAILTNPVHADRQKPFIISITASNADTLRSMVQSIQILRAKLHDDHTDPNSTAKSKIAIEINTSCPNIPNASPSGYAIASLLPMLKVLAEAFNRDHTLTIGLKLPPFVYREQFMSVLDGIESLTAGGKCPFSFLTCTNTLGNSLLFSDQTVSSVDIETGSDFALPTVIGGLAGEALHALALGNVYTFSQLVRNRASLNTITIIGAGGVTSKEATMRMRKAGAAVVGCATLFGREGVRAFELLAA
ncbi:hypothetical protein BDQ12DRAFT_625968 [Crucibulum laeve]|uniref:Dihydroorotate oxidase n=1 Tax=Crucibulum laeve TaxID=68775 RepID=A0A5C3MIB6_9AGAR|nr:hypothetical protein BDQ12DRAFT_625968 [Crucibulum laeve]